MNRPLVIAGFAAVAWSALGLTSRADAERPTITNLPPHVTEQLRVSDYGVAVPIRDFRRTCTTGTRLPLFQENEQFYIAKVSTLEYGEQLCAFPKVDNLGVGTAWVTNEKLLIFGIPTRSVPGRLFLTKNETLPLLEESEAEYVVLLERYGEWAPLGIPKSLAGLVREPIPPPPKMAPEPPPEPRRITLDMAALEQMSPPPAPRKAARRTTHVAHPPSPTEAAAPAAGEAPPAPSPAPAQTPSQPPAARAEEKVAAEPARPEAAKPSPGWWSRVPVTVIVLQVFVLALIAQIFLFMHRKRQPAGAATAPTPVQDVQTFSTLGESLAANYFQNLAHETGDFSGSLEGFSAAELVQFLHSAQETGVLLVKDANEKVTGEFYFAQGEIVDAIHGEKRAESAVHDLFRGHDASFAFNRVDVSKRARTVHQGTMGLLLEASKNLDEQQGLDR